MTRFITQLFLVALIATLAACNQDEISSSVDPGKITTAGDALLVDEVEIGQMAMFDQIPENQSESIERSFENAPPFIPHTVAGMTVITKSKNVCLHCHAPSKAEAEKATPIPPSHFTDYRPEIIEKDGLLAVNAEEGQVISNSTGDQLNMAQYNCNLCHVALTNATVEISNTFQADFRESNGKSRSNLSKNIAEGIR